MSVKGNKVQVNSHKKVISPDGKLKSFDEIEVSTKTVIAITNLSIDLDRFFTYIPITDHTPAEKKRGRKKRISPPQVVSSLPFGSIVLAQKKREFRGNYIKSKTKKSKTFFLHSVTIVVFLENNKDINVKVSANGKLQITGCKEDNHFIQAVIILYKTLQNIEKMTNEKVFEVRGNEEGILEVVFNTVMQNMDFKLGFNICRDKLDNFINLKTNYRSIFESSLSTGVNIKIKREPSSENNILKLNYHPQTEEIKQEMVPYSVYCNLLEAKEKKKEVKKEKHHTFLVFATGSIIMSSQGRDMHRVFNELVEILIKNKDNFEDKTDKPLINLKELSKEEIFNMWAVAPGHTGKPLEKLIFSKEELSCSDLSEEDSEVDDEELVY